MKKINRREALKWIGVSSIGAAGYVGGLRVVDSPDRTVSVSGDVPDGLPISVGGAVERHVTEQHPAVVRFRVTNTGDHEIVTQYPAEDATVTAPSPIPVTVLEATREDESAELVFIPKDRSHIQPVVDPVPTTRGVTNCWHARTASWGQDDISKLAELGPGESVESRYTLLHNPETSDRVLPGDCLEPGRYRLQQPCTLERMSDETDGETTRSATLEYRIELS